MSALTGKHVLVLGLGESGLAMARWCVLRGARVRVADSRRVPPGRDALREDAPLAELISGDFGAEVLDGIDLVALSPGLDPRVGVAAEARRRGLPISGEITLLADALHELGVREHTRILAITGTSGKTTTASICAAMLEAAGKKVFLGGNIGVPLSEYVLGSNPTAQSFGKQAGKRADVLVLEISSFQLQTCRSFCPNVGMLLNISENHLDYHADMAEYSAAKFKLFACQTSSNYAIFPAEMSKNSVVQGLAAKKIFFKVKKIPPLLTIAPVLPGFSFDVYGV